MTKEELLEALKGLDPEERKEFYKGLEDKPDIDNLDEALAIIKKLRQEAAEHRVGKKEANTELENYKKELAEKEKAEEEERLRAQKKYKELLDAKELELSQLKSNQETTTQKLQELQEFKEKQFEKKLNMIDDLSLIHI